MSDTDKDELAGTEQPFVQHLIELRDHAIHEVDICEDSLAAAREQIATLASHVEWLEGELQRRQAARHAADLRVFAAVAEVAA